MAITGLLIGMATKSHGREMVFVGLGGGRASGKVVMHVLDARVRADTKMRTRPKEGG